MKILALDQATHCGWAISSDVYGVWNLTIKKDESSGMKWIRFKAKLHEICSLEKIELVVYERVSGLYKNSIIHSAKMVAIIETYCEENGIQYRAYSSTEIKKFATGKGNCNKELMIKFAKKKYGYKGKDDNEADSLHLLHLAKEDLSV